MLTEGEANELRSVVQKFGGFVPRLAALYVALFILPGIQMPFFPIWLKAKDVDDSLMGIVRAVPMVARVLAIPLVAQEADRRDAVRDVLNPCECRQRCWLCACGAFHQRHSHSTHLYTDVAFLHAA